MTVRQKKNLSTLLYEYYVELSQTCNYDCTNCDIGILESYGSGYTCPLEVVMRKLDEDLYAR